MLARLIGWYLSLALRTTRWTLVGRENLAPRAAGVPAVIAFWHEHLPAMSMLTFLTRSMPEYRRPKVHTLVSQHRDGRFIGDIVSRFGIGTVYGSSSRGGAASLRQMLRLLSKGDIVAITPDGPRGPRRHADAGVAQLAALAGVPVVPCASCTTRRVILKTWDRMVIPLPFGRGVMVCGPEIVVPRDGWRDSVHTVTMALNAAADRAEQLCPR